MSHERKREAFVREATRHFSHRENLGLAIQALSAVVRSRYSGGARLSCAEAIGIADAQRTDSHAQGRRADAVHIAYAALRESIARLSGQRAPVRRGLANAEDLRALVEVAGTQITASAFADHLAFVERLAAEDPSLSLRALAADEAECLRRTGDGSERRKYDEALGTARRLLQSPPPAAESADENAGRGSDAAASRLERAFKYGHVKALWSGIEWALPAAGSHEMHEDVYRFAIANV